MAERLKANSDGSATVTLEVTDKTLEAMHDLAKITGIEGENELGQLVHDALRSHEYFIARQTEGREIFSLDQEDISALNQEPTFSGDSEYIAQIIPEDRMVDAKDYFRRAEEATT